MQEYYKIGEISKLYGICADSLRYYEEIGVLSPERDENGYRLYSITDIWRLNVIKDLRRLDFSMQHIKDYLDNRSISSTLRLLEEEDVLIKEQIEGLMRIQRNIAKKVSLIQKGLGIKEGEFSIRKFPERKCFQIKENIKRDEDIDLLKKKLQSRHEDKLYILGNSCIGSRVPLEYIRKQQYHHYNSVFVIDESSGDSDFILESGNYATVSYRGDYIKNADYVPRLVQYAGEKGYRLMGDLLELLLIDIHETADSNEFSTELQIRVERESFSD